MNPKFKLIMAVMPLLIMGLGCSKLIPGNVNLFEGDNAAQAAAAIKKEVGTEKVNVIRVEIRPRAMKVTIQSPGDPKHQDQYTYENRSVYGPEPVKIPNVFADNIPRTTEIGDVNFAAIPEMLKRAIELSKDKGAKVGLISMDQQPTPNIIPVTAEERRNTTWDLTFRIFVEGTRVSKDFWADKQGNIVDR